MKTRHRWLGANSMALLLAVATPVLAQDSSDLPVAAANPNTRPAGDMLGGVLQIELEIPNARNGKGPLDLLSTGGFDPRTYLPGNALFISALPE